MTAVLADLWPLVAVMAAGLAAGAANAVAGGGSAISFPLLVFVGLPPIAANATNAVGLVPGGVTASWSYRDRLRSDDGLLRRLLLPSVLGGLLGAWLLIRLPAAWFDAVAPWLVLLAAGSVALEPLARRRVGAGAPADAVADDRRAGRVRRKWRGGAAWLLVSLYGGYFGAGMGLFFLTTLGLLGVRDLQQANALKNLLSVVIKAAAVTYFIAMALPVWSFAAALMAGAAAGGWVAGRLIQRVSTERLRGVVAAVGAGLGLLMLIR